MLGRRSGFGPGHHRWLERLLSTDACCLRPTAAGRSTRKRFAATAGLDLQAGISRSGAGAASNNRIGGMVDADRNVISGNTVDGIQMEPSAGITSADIVQGNHIGLNAAGDPALRIR